MKHIIINGGFKAKVVNDKYKNIIVVELENFERVVVYKSDLTEVVSAAPNYDRLFYTNKAYISVKK